MAFLKIDGIVKIVVDTAAKATARDTFNVGLIVGKSNHISTTDRCKVYNGLSGMVDDGFTENDPEYKAATLYFAQDPTPDRLCVGVCGSSETWVQALTACKAVNAAWYGAYIAAPSASALTSADHQAVATFLNTLTAAYFFDDSADADKGSVSTDVFSVMKSLSLNRSTGIFSKTPYAGAALMGVAMGHNTGAANSAYTLAFKSLAGVPTDDLNETDILNLTNKNANYYVTRAASYNMVQPGVTVTGDWFDELIGLDQLANDMQLGCMDVLAHTKTKIPYTDPGAMRFVLACNEACRNARVRGFFAPGIWDGPNILDLERGDALSEGYMCQAEPVADQGASNKSRRICPPIYVCGIMAGAIHSLVVNVNVA